MFFKVTPNEPGGCGILAVEVDDIILSEKHLHFCLVLSHRLPLEEACKILGTTVEEYEEAKRMTDAGGKK